MNNVIISLIGFSLVMIILVGVLIKIIVENQKKYTQLKNAYESDKKVIEYYKQYVEEIKRINKEKGNAIEKIKEAKTDEEIFDIINSTAILANNERVHNNKTETGTSAKTTKRRTSGSKKC